MDYKGLLTDLEWEVTAQCSGKYMMDINGTKLIAVKMVTAQRRLYLTVNFRYN